MTYYTFFHPTGVEVDICCWKRASGKQHPPDEAVEAAHQRPQVLDLGETDLHRNEQVGNANGGTEEPTTYVKSKSRLSVSRWV